MSTLASGVKSNYCVSKVNTERRSASVENSSTERERAGGFQDTRGKKWITRASTECIQTTKNLHERRRTLLKSKGEWVSTPENQDKCLGQLHFTSFYSLRFPTRRDNHKTNIRIATKLRSNDLKCKAGVKEAIVQRPEFGEKDFPFDTLRESALKTTEDEDVSKSHNDDTIYLWGNHVEHDISSHRSSDGIQHGLTLCDQGQPAKNCTQGQSAGCEHVTELQVTESECVEGQSGVNDPQEQNAEGTLSHSNLIPFRKDTGSKADSYCQVCACSPTAIDQALLLPSYPASHYSDNLKSDLISSTAAMFTSTLVSVLAPHWSGHLRRHKRGFSDVGPDIAQNMHVSALSQNEQQQRFPLQQIQAQGEPVTDFSNRLRGSAGTSRSSVEWQNESLSESKKQFFETSSLRRNRHTVEQRTEFGNPVRVLKDSREVSKSTLSLQLSDYRRMAQSVDQVESFSSLRSRPTTSTLLLSSRRLNSRKPIPETFQMEKQLSASVSCLNLPSKSILRTSQPQPNLVSPTDPAKETLVTRTALASPDQLSYTHKPKPFSPKWAETDSSRKQRYLITGDFDVINRTPPTNDTTRERLFSNYATKFNQSETLRSVQNHGAVDQFITDNTNLQDSNSNIPDRSAWISPNENANSRFVYPQMSSNSDSVLKRQMSKTSMMSTNLDPSTPVQSNRINDMINLNKTSTINSTARPRTIQSISRSPSVSLSPAPLTKADQNSIQNSSNLDKLSSCPVNSVRMKSFTESLSFSPLKDSPVEGTSPSHLWSNYLNSKRQSKESNRSPLDQPSPLSPSEFKPRRFCTPSIYTYLRETSPPKSAQASPALSSPSPQTSYLKEIQEEDKNSSNLWFTFDLSPVESHDLLLKPDSSSTSAPHSLSSETSRRSVSRLSKSPYSTLISTRAAVNSLSSPPVTHQHSRSFSYSGSPVDAKPPKVEKRSYTSVLRDRLSQRKSLRGEPVGSNDIQITAKSVSVSQDGISKSSIDTKFPDCQTNTLIPDTTHPQQTDTVFKNIPHEGLNGQGDKSNAYAADRFNFKELSLPQDSSTVSEAVQKGRVTEILQTNGTLPTTENSKSKSSLFSLSNKKDNFLMSSQSTCKEGLAVKKGEMAGLKTSKKVDQVLNRLKLTFGSKFSEDSDTTSRRKTKKEEASNDKACESIKKEKESDDQTVKRRNKPEDLLDSKASERTMTLDQIDNLTVRTQTKTEKVLERKAPERSRKLYQMDNLTVRTRTNPEKVLERKAPEITRKLDQMDNLTIRTQSKPEKVSDIKVPERSRKLDQMDNLTVRTQTKPEKVSGIKVPERSRKLYQMDNLTVRTQTKPEKVSDIKAPERNGKLDQMDNLTVRTQTKPEKVLEKKVPEMTRKLDQTDDLTVRRKTKNEMLLDRTKRNVEQRLSASQSLNSPNSLNTHIIYMIDSSTSSGPTSGFRHVKQNNMTNMDKHKRLMEESRNPSLSKPLSPNWPMPDNNNCYATLPPGKRSRLGPSPTLSPFECFSEDEQNDNVFFSNVLTKRNNTSLGEPESVAQPDNNIVKVGMQNSTGVVLSSPCADLKYGLQRGRSVSVSSVVSGRPSGPGRISTGSSQGSFLDLSSLDSFLTKSRHSSINSPVGSPENDVQASSGHLSYNGLTERLSSQDSLRSLDNLEPICPWYSDQIPPYSPMSILSVSQISSPSPASSRISPDSLSPRGCLPSRNYQSMLYVSEESGSETTTDDEYYLHSDDDDEKETEL